VVQTHGEKLAEPATGARTLGTCSFLNGKALALDTSWYVASRFGRATVHAWGPRRLGQRSAGGKVP
jgi:hypothetical protein